MNALDHYDDQPDRAFGTTTERRTDNIRKLQRTAFIRGCVVGLSVGAFIAYIILLPAITTALSL